MESLCIEVTLGKTRWLIACPYKIQHIKDLDFENIMSDMLENSILDYDKYIIMGDINFDMLTAHHENNSISHIITQSTCF